MKTITVYARKVVAAELIRWLDASRAADIRQVVIAGEEIAVASAARDAGARVLSWMQRQEIEPTDLAVSLLFPKRLRADQLSLARLGAINFHPAPLPEYRGVGGYNLAILEGLTQWAVTAHYMTETIDAGPIIDVEWFPFDPESATIASLMDKSNGVLSTQAKRVIKAAVEADGPLPTIPNEGGRYVDRNELEAMKRIEPGDDVARKVRAFWFPPYRGAYVEIDGKAYTLVDDDLLRDHDPS